METLKNSVITIVKPKFEKETVNYVDTFKFTITDTNKISGKEVLDFFYRALQADGVVCEKIKYTSPLGTKYVSIESKDASSVLLEFTIKRDGELMITQNYINPKNKPLSKIREKLFNILEDIKYNFIVVNDFE